MLIDFIAINLAFIIGIESQDINRSVAEGSSRPFFKEFEGSSHL